MLPNSKRSSNLFLKKDKCRKGRERIEDARWFEGSESGGINSEENHGQKK
jgi:hypothetical protein